MKLADGRELRLLPVGTRVRHVQHSALTGRIAGIEMNGPGVASAIPYRVDWDDPARAADLAGWLNCYQDAGDVVPVEFAERVQSATFGSAKDEM